MHGTQSELPAYRFGAFELDCRSGDLRKLGIRIKLQDQPREILFLLLEHAGEVVTREQIQKQLWPENTFVDFDNAINSAVRKLREALGDTADNPRYIETLARRGYRFIGPLSPRPLSSPESAQPAPPPPQVAAQMQGNGRRWVVAALAGVVGLLALAAWWMIPRTAREPADIRVAPLTSNTGLEFQPSFSPDGTRVAYVWNGPERKDFALYVKTIGAGEPMRLSNEGPHDFSPAWSPDGRWVAGLRDTGPEAAVLLFPASGGRPRELTRFGKASEAERGCVDLGRPFLCGLMYWGPLLAWSPDGKYLFASGYAKPDSPLSILRISVETGEQLPLTSPPAGTAGDFGPAVSPDGSELIFVRSLGAKQGDLYAARLSKAVRGDTPVRRITFDNADLQSPVWVSGGRELLFSSDRGGRREIWRMQLTTSNNPVRAGAFGEGASDLAVAPGGNRVIYTRGGYQGSIWRVPIEGGNGKAAAPLTESTARDKFTHISPDGSRIAFQSRRSGNDEIWICDADGKNAMQLTSFGKGMSGSPRWSPDGNEIAFDSNVAGNFDVYLIHARGGQPKRLTTNPATDAVPNWSRDGKWIYFTSSRTGRFEIWKIQADGSSETQVTRDGAFTSAESLDGKYLYVKRGSEDGGQVWKMPAGGGPASKLLDSVSGRLFTVTGKGIYYAAPERGFRLKYLNFATGTVTDIAPLGTFGHADVSTDERWAYYPAGGSSGENLIVVENFR